MLVIIVFVAFVYFGGSNVPKVLRDNKELLLGVVAGLALCSFMGMRLEGWRELKDAGECESLCGDWARKSDEGGVTNIVEACPRNPQNYQYDEPSSECRLRMSLPELAPAPPAALALPSDEMTEAAAQQEVAFAPPPTPPSLAPLAPLPPPQTPPPSPAPGSGQ